MPRLTMFGLWWTHSSATPTALSPKIAKSLSISEIRALKRGSGGRRRLLSRKVPSKQLGDLRHESSDSSSIEEK